MTKELRDALKTRIVAAKTDAERLSAHDQAITAVLDCTASLHANIKQTAADTEYIRHHIELKEAEAKGKTAGAAQMLNLLRIACGFGGGAAVVKIIEVLST